jgi:hypothetical protein
MDDKLIRGIGFGLRATRRLLNRDTTIPAIHMMSAIAPATTITDLKSMVAFPFGGHVSRCTDH